MGERKTIVSFELKSLSLSLIREKREKGKRRRVTKREGKEGKGTKEPREKGRDLGL